MRIHLYTLLFAGFLSVKGQETAKTETYQSPLYNRIDLVGVSPDGKTLIASDSSGYIFFWGRDGSLRKILRAHLQQVTDIAFSSDGAYLATTATDNQIIVWNFLTGEKVSSVFVDSRVLSFAFNQESSLLFYATRHGLYKTSSKELKNPEKIYDGETNCADESNDNKFFITGDENNLYLFNPDEANPVSKISTCSGLKKVEFRGNAICLQCEDGSFHFFELKATLLKEIGSWKSELVEPAKMFITEDRQVLLLNRNKSLLWNPSLDRFYNVMGLPESFTAFGYGDKGNYYAGNKTGKVVSCVPLAGEEMTSLYQPTKKQQPNTETKTETTTPGIEITTSGIPATINGRSVKAQQPVEVISSPSLDIYVWDDEHEDGDTISLNMNGDWILQDYMITAQKKGLTVNLVPGKANYLILYAHNLGKFPPNTAVISFHDGKTERMLTVESDLKRCGAVTFNLKK